MNGQRIEGFNDVTYTPVEAYGVSTYDFGIISGGGGDNVTVTQNTRFFWVYNPDNTSTSGFTGTGNWFFDKPNTPLYGKNDILTQFANGTKTNLDVEFQEWQIKVSSQSEEQDFVGDFIAYLLLAGGRSCYKSS